MKVKVTKVGEEWISEELKEIGFSKKSVLGIELGEVYEVHAIVLWQNAIFYQVTRSGHITWLPSTVFEVLDHSVPKDWLANQFDEEVPFILGPSFIIQNKQAYVDMVDLMPEQVRQFRVRLENKRGLSR